MNKKGFTLVEMIVVILLFGVIAVVAIPAVLKAMNTQNNEKYDTHMKLVEQALDLYAIRYKGDFDNNPNVTKYKISYSQLKSNELVKENGISCYGNIYFNKKKNNTYEYEYYLTCTDDKDGKKYVEKQGTDTFSCDASNNCSVIGS